MIIIGEKINGAIPAVKAAILSRDAEAIRSLALRQAETGADYIDCCAGLHEGEREAMAWLIDCIQSVTDTPIAVDSPDPAVCVEAMQLCARPGIVNSVSGEKKKLETILPAVAGTSWKVMTLLCDDRGIPKTADGRLAVLDAVMAEAKRYGIPEGRIFIDPMVEMLCASEEGISVIREVITGARKAYPKAHISCAVSNISYQLPYRRIVNLSFAVMATAFGMDAAVLDPLSRDLRGAIYAAEALLGQDEYCMEYIGAYREGLFGTDKKHE